MDRRSGIIAGPIGNDYFKKNKDDSSQNTRSHPYVTNPNIRVPGQPQPQRNVPKHMEPQVIRLSAEDINMMVSNMVPSVVQEVIPNPNDFADTPLSMAGSGVFNYSREIIIGAMTSKGFWKGGLFFGADVLATYMLNIAIANRNNILNNSLNKIELGEAQGLEMIITPNTTSSPYPIVNIDFSTY